MTNGESLGKGPTQQAETGNAESLKIMPNIPNCSKNTHIISKNQNEQRLATWQGSENGTQKQSGYIMIDKLHQNWTMPIKKQRGGGQIQILYIHIR